MDTQKILHSKKTKIAIFAAAIVLAAISVFGWHKFYALAQSVIDNFTSTSRVANTWNVNVNTGTGQVTLATRACDNGTWFCSANTTCSDSLGDGSYIIVKRVNEASSLAWKTTNTDCARPNCGQDGGQDGDNLVADNTVNFSSYPARNACQLAGGRLPTTTELQCIYANQATFGNNFGTGSYWSSTENSTTHAWYFDFGGGGADDYTKTYPNSVRCVRGW